MRVVGGEARGRRLAAPDLPGLRPTSDRVREAVFDILEARRLVEGLSFVDLFAGSGALGIEALSRGAASCLFVDSEPLAVKAVEGNLATTGMSGRAGVRVVRAEVLAYLAATDVNVEVAVVDPPYRFSGWAELVTVLPAANAVLEHGAPIEVVPPFDTVRTYRYGGTLVTLVARRPTDKDLV